VDLLDALSAVSDVVGSTNQATGLMQCHQAQTNVSDVSQSRCLSQ